jgi:hypothetical protein
MQDSCGDDTFRERMLF